MKTRYPASLGFLTLLWAAMPAFPIELGALEPELVTDRPDQTESAEVVPAGSLQVEVGGLFLREEIEGGSLGTREAPGTLLRYGVTPRFELRLGWPGEIEMDPPAGSGEARRRGLADPEVGFKLAFGELWATRARGALLVHATLPAGEKGFGSPRADLSARLAVAHYVTERTGFAWNLGLESSSFEDGRGDVHTLARWIYTGAIGFELNPRWGLFVELFGDLPASDTAPAAHSLDGGVTFRLRPALQLDAAAGFGYVGAAPDFFAGVGISFRLDR